MDQVLFSGTLDLSSTTLSSTRLAGNLSETMSILMLEGSDLELVLTKYKKPSF